MSQNLIVVDQPPHLPILWEEEQTLAKAYAKEQHAKSTRKAYESDIRIFALWCENRSLPSLPALPETVAVFISYEAGEGVSVSTLKRRVAAIKYLHSLAGHEPPTSSELVKATLKGIRRTLGSAPTQKAPATAEKMTEMLRLIPNTLRGKRDKALLLLGFAGAFRRSELAALKLNDVSEGELGFRVLIRKSKTDQEGQGQEVAIYNGRLKVVEAVKEWCEAANITEGYLFRPVKKGGRVLDQALSCRSIADIVKKYAGFAGFVEGDYAGHSLRSGFITSAAERGASLFKMMEVSRHKSVDTLKGYVRRAELFKDHAGAGFL